jgi:hypothetical protein
MTARRPSNTAQRRDDPAQTPPAPFAPVEIAFAFVPTLDGVKSLLNGVSARLPDQAPPPPSRKGTAWQEGYSAGIADARDIVAWIRDGLEVRGDLGASPAGRAATTRAEGC